MKVKLDKENLDQLVSDVTTKRYIFGAVFYVSSPDHSLDLISADGDIKEDSQYYIASINKFFVSAIILKLFAQKKLDLEDKVSKYLEENLIRRIHVHKDKDYSKALRLKHLISQTSGLPCYLKDKQVNGKKAMTELEKGIDQPWPIEKVIQEVKRMKTHFPPGKAGKAKYIDTNHQILGLVIEKITGEPVNIVLKHLFQELNLTSTYVCEEKIIGNFVPLRYKSEKRYLPLFLASTRNDIISTARDQMTFLKAFFNGYFFPKERLGELERWNKIFFPLKYGIGLQKFSMPRIFSPFHQVPHMVGHCGSTGSLAFYVPEMDIYITGSINQQARPSIAFQTMIKIISKLKY
jgi:CubicO group peptidase (beta-lactamase class C family)